MNKKPVVIVLLLVIIGGSLFWLYDTQFKEPKIDLNIYEALGSVTAEQTAKLIGNRGEVVAVTWDFSKQPMPVVEAQINSFTRALKQHGNIHLAAMEKKDRDPARMMATGGAVPAEELIKIAKAHPSAGAIVLFMAFPNLSPEQLQSIRQGATRFVVVSGFNPGYKKLLADHAISLAIVPQFDRTKNTRPPQSVQESFDQNYQVVTADHVATLPY